MCVLPLYLLLLLQYAQQVTVDWETIKAKEEKELDDETARNDSYSNGSSMRK
jgi:hypothetical protein